MQRSFGVFVAQMVGPGRVPPRQLTGHVAEYGRHQCVQLFDTDPAFLQEAQHDRT
jgi:hypothetical protein